MPTAPVNDAGAAMYYEDSGAPGDSRTYTTVIIIHGLAFHGACFLPLFKYAATSNRRILSLNLRDYPGSTRYTPEELACLWSNEEKTETAALRSQGLEIAAFIRHVVLTENIPAIQEVDGKKTGGVVLLPWSVGSVWPLAMLAHAESIDKDTMFVLNKWLRAFILYEPPHASFGLSLPDEIYYIAYDSSVPPDELPLAFAHWIGAFHMPLPDLSDDVRLHGQAARPAMHTISSDPGVAPTAQQMSAAELDTIVDLTILQRSCRNLSSWKMKGAYRNAERALFNSDGTFREMDVVLIWGDMSVPLCTFAAAYMKKRFEDAVREGNWKFAREARFVKVEGGNHFIHWHHPEKFLKIVLQSIS